MNRRFLTAALPILVLTACGGMPEEADGSDLGEANQALEIFWTTVASTQDPVPARDGNTSAFATATASSPPPAILVVTSPSSNPGGTRSSTQDPIPAKVRNDGKPNPNDPNSPNGPR